MARFMTVGKFRRRAKDDVVFHRHFTSDPEAAVIVIGALIRQFERIRLRSGDITNIEIALSEVINNINEHAYGGAPNRPIEIRAELADGAINFVLVDCGVEMLGGVLENCKQPVLNGVVSWLPEGGFGLFMLRQVAENLNYIRKNGENHFSFSITIVAQND